MIELFVGAALFGSGFWLSSWISGRQENQVIANQIRELERISADYVRLVDEKREVSQALVDIQRKMNGLPTVSARPGDSRIDVGTPPEELVEFCAQWKEGARLLNEARRKVLAGSTWQEVTDEYLSSFQELNVGVDTIKIMR